jgi:hypothetical protein
VSDGTNSAFSFTKQKEMQLIQAQHHPCYLGLLWVLTALLATGFGVSVYGAVGESADSGMGVAGMIVFGIPLFFMLIVACGVTCNNILDWYRGRNYDSLEETNVSCSEFKKLDKLTLLLKE